MGKLGRALKKGSRLMVAPVRAGIGALRRAGSASPPLPAGIFLTHTTNPRMLRHFEKLRAESEGEIDWRLVVNPWTLDDLVAGRTDFVAEGLMERRIGDAAAAGHIHLGYLDLILVPLALAAGTEFVWVMEYDVDFSGNWRRFFSEFRGNRADLLCTDLRLREDDPNWVHWTNARAPQPLTPDEQIAGFFPLFRTSRRLLLGHVEEMATAGWDGHYEYLLPTVAARRGLRVEDIGGSGRFVPWERRHRHYWVTRRKKKRPVGSFVYTPPRPFYFSERPQEFERPNMIYHPVKPDIPRWQDELKAQRQSSGG